MERIKSLTISDYHFINPIKNPTKKKMENPENLMNITKIHIGPPVFMQINQAFTIIYYNICELIRSKILFHSLYCIHEGYVVLITLNIETVF